MSEALERYTAAQMAIQRFEYDHRFVLNAYADLEVEARAAEEELRTEARQSGPVENIYWTVSVQTEAQTTAVTIKRKEASL